MLFRSPNPTPLVEQARRAGRRAENGLGVLVHQAVIGFELFTGVPAPIDAMRGAVGISKP